MHSFMKTLSSLSLTLLFVAGCAIDIPVPKIEIPPGTVKINIDEADLQKELDKLSGNSLVCSAGLPASAGGVVNPDVATPINVSATGGTGPYTILGTAVSFSSSTVISRTYTNNTSANLAVVDSVSVLDDANHVTQCNFVVTVLPKVNPSNLACTLTSSPTSAAVDANISLLTQASGGAGGYTFSNLDLASGGSVVSALAPINSTQASATVKFSSSGYKTNSVRVTDSSSNFVICSSTVNILNQASVSLVATPSSVVPITDIITVTAVGTGFTSTPSYIFTTTSSGIQLVPSGSNAVRVAVTDGVAHPSVIVKVVATSGSQSATSTIDLGFTASSSPLVCSVSHPSGTYRVGDSVPFTASATNGEALVITSFVTTSDATVTDTSNSVRTVKYANPGFKNVYVMAKSASSGKWCNEGNYLVDSLEVFNSTTPPTNPLACSAYTNPDPTLLNQTFYAYGVLTGGNGYNRWVEYVRVYKNGSLVTNYSGYWYDRYTAVLWITSTKGTYQVQLTAKDSWGNTATCSTDHVVQ